MKKITFLDRAVYEVHGPSHPDNPVYEKGETVSLRDDLADRWIKRKVAILESEAKAAAKAAADVAAPAAPPKESGSSPAAGGASGAGSAAGAAKG